MIKKEMFICEISIIVILIRQKLWSVRHVQQKIKLPLPNKICDIWQKVLFEIVGLGT